MENQLDVAQLPFVHRTTIGASGEAYVEGPYIEVEHDVIQVWVTNRKDDSSTQRTMAQLEQNAKTSKPGLVFIFPGLWLLNLGNNLQNFIAFAPVNEHCTRYYVRVYYRAKVPLLSRVLAHLTGRANLLILNQDRKLIITQTPANSLAAEHDKLISADRTIIAYRKKLKAALEL